MRKHQPWHCISDYRIKLKNSRIKTRINPQPPRWILRNAEFNKNVMRCHKVSDLKCFKGEVQGFNALIIWFLVGWKHHFLRKMSGPSVTQSCRQWTLRVNSIFNVCRARYPIGPTFSLPARSTRYSFPLSFCSVSTFSCLMFIRKMLWLRELCSFMSKEQSEDRGDSNSDSFYKMSFNSLFLIDGVVKRDVHFAPHRAFLCFAP